MIVRWLQRNMYACGAPLDWLSLGRGALVLMFIICVLFPTAFTVVKAVLLFLSLVVVTTAVQFGRLRRSGRLILLSVFFSVIGIFWSIYGAVVGNPGAIRVLTVMAAYPLIFSLLAPYWDRDYSIQVCDLFLVISAALVFLNYLFLWSASQDGVFSSLMVSLYGEAWAVLDTSKSTVKYTLPSVSSMLFMFPFVILLGMCFKRKEAVFLCATGCVFGNLVGIVGAASCTIFDSVWRVQCFFNSRDLGPSNFWGWKASGRDDLCALGPLRSGCGRGLGGTIRKVWECF